MIIGNGGAEYGVRGYVTAYDAETGKQVWRFFIVPGDPAKPFEDEAMEMAAKTWTAGEYWENGGGGTPWDAITYDPELNLIYVGTGNGSPWNRNLRSPGGGDNLFLASIVALNADTGEYVWHYQETPGDTWDYTATQPMILADLTIDGEPRKVLMQAPKNGFFYVIDRTNGKLISAKNFVEVNWATGYDADGRPIEMPEARSPDKPFDAIPGPFGAHNWQPMSFSPRTGLVYIPAQNVPINLTGEKNWKHNAQPARRVHGQPRLERRLCAQRRRRPKPTVRPLIAWDPVKQKEAWRQEHVSPWNGGTLATAGNLVFQGTADGRFVAYDATTGEKLWDAPTGTGVVAAAVDLPGRRQAIRVGGGRLGRRVRPGAARHRANSPGTVYTFAIGGKATLPDFAKYQMDRWCRA